MRYQLYEKQATHFQMYDSPHDLLTRAAAANKRRQFCRPSGDFMELHKGHKLRTWDDVINALNVTDPENVKKVNEFIEEIRNEHLPQPVDRRRKRRWSDNDGELDVDRRLQGESVCFRDIRRINHYGPTHAIILCNLDGYAAHNAECIFWRGAAAVAAVDLLEEQGFTCEVVQWCKGGNVFGGRNHKQLTCSRLKKSGDPLDSIQLMNGLSGWYLRYGVFASWADCPKAFPKGYGYADFDLDNATLEMLELDSTAKRIDFAATFTKEDAIRETVKAVVAMTPKMEAMVGKEDWEL